MLFKVKGILDFKPQNVSKKHEAQSEWKSTALILTKCDISDYYSWFLKTRFNLNLNRTLRGTHVTIINDKMDVKIFEEASKIFHKKEITFYYENIPISNAKHWWLRVWCPEAEAIRESLGLSRMPHLPFHLTIGIINPKNFEHSKYILECCKQFNIIPYESRKPLDEYEIYKGDL